MEASFTPTRYRTSQHASPNVALVDALLSPRDRNLGADRIIRAIPSYANDDSALVTYRDLPGFPPGDRRLSVLRRVYRVRS